MEVVLIGMYGAAMLAIVTVFVVLARQAPAVRGGAAGSTAARLAVFGTALLAPSMLTDWLVLPGGCACVAPSLALNIFTSAATVLGFLAPVGALTALLVLLLLTTVRLLQRPDGNCRLFARP